MSRKINKNLKRLVTSHKKGADGVVLEGSSRSGKTISSVDFVIYLCTKVESNCTINIVKETYQSFKTTLFLDFKMRLDDFGLDNPFQRKVDVESFKIFGNQINFIGADKPSKFQGAGSDYVWINEGIFVARKIFDQLEMRCRKMFWIDYNPSATEHWIYDSVIPREGVDYMHSTWKDNPFISEKEKKKILSYNPWHPDDADLPEEQRRPHPVNVKQGTADKFMWMVYGLGMRGQLEGLIYTNWRKIPDDQYPTDGKFWYGIDFGYSNDEAAIVRVCKHNGEYYLHEVMYKKEQFTSDYSNAIRNDYISVKRSIYDFEDLNIYSEDGSIFINRKEVLRIKDVWKNETLLTDVLHELNLNNDEIISIVKFVNDLQKVKTVMYCDSARPEIIGEMRTKFNLNANKCYKPTIESGIMIVKKYVVNYTASSKNIAREQQGYMWQKNKQSDEFINKPTTEKDHLMDASRYGITTYERVTNYA